MKSFYRFGSFALMLVGLPLVAHSQTNGCIPNAYNLLPDPGFENQKSMLSGDRFNVRSRTGYTDELASWESANAESPDYFASNAPLAPFPGGFMGSSNPSTSDIGPFLPLDNSAALHNGTVGIASQPGYSEYITPSSGALKLPKDGAYYATFWVNRPASPNNPATSGLGMALSIQDYSTSREISFPDGTLSPYFQSTAINGTGQWTHVGGIIDNVKASQSYHVIVGNLRPIKKIDGNLLTSSKVGVGTTGNSNSSYYYIDNVALYRIPTAGAPVVSTQSCGASVTIGEGSPIPCATYEWTSTQNDLTPGQTNRLQIVVNPSVETTYTLKVTMPGRSGTFVWKSTSVIVKPPTLTSFVAPVVTPLPATLCLTNGPKYYDLFATNTPGATSYSWSVSPVDGGSIVSATGNSARVKFAQGNYVATVSVVANYACGSSAPVTQTVRVSGLPAYPVLTQVDPMQYIGRNQAKFSIDNYESNVRYTVYNIQFANPTSPPNFTRPDFIVKGGGGSSADYEGYFYIKAENACGSVTSETISVTYLVTMPYAQRTQTSAAYPNPANESLTLPVEAREAILLNTQGRPVQRADANGRVDTRHLPAGLYNLQFRENGKLINQRIEVTH